MKFFYFLASLMLALTVFSACADDDDQLQPITEDIPFAGGGFSFDHGVLIYDRSNTNGTYRLTLYLLENPADRTTSGLIGLPADVVKMQFYAQFDRDRIADGTYYFGPGLAVTNWFIKRDFSFNSDGFQYIKSGSLTVLTDGDKQTFTFDVKIVNSLDDRDWTDVQGLPMKGSVTVPVRLLE